MTKKVVKINTGFRKGTVFKEKKVISVADLDKATQELLDSIRENRR